MLPGPVDRRRRSSGMKGGGESLLGFCGLAASPPHHAASCSSWRKEQELNLRCLVSVMCAGQPGMLISGSRGQNLGEVSRLSIPVVRNKSANCVMVALKIRTLEMIQHLISEVF